MPPASFLRVNMVHVQLLQNQGFSIYTWTQPNFCHYCLDKWYIFITRTCCNWLSRNQMEIQDFCSMTSGLGCGNTDTDEASLFSQKVLILSRFNLNPNLCSNAARNSMSLLLIADHNSESEQCSSEFALCSKYLLTVWTILSHNMPRNSFLSTVMNYGCKPIHLLQQHPGV